MVKVWYNSYNNHGMKGSITMKKFIKYTAALAASAAITISASVNVLAAPANSFSDVGGDQYSWAASDIQRMSRAGYIKGYDDGTYRPDNEVTRQECLSLFARLMGCGAEENEKILEIAHEQFDDVIKPYGLTWGTDEITYLMYKGVLSESDLMTYLKNDEKSKPMTRYEAAIIITKAMGGNSTAAADKNAHLDYSDFILIPASAVGYVKYASDKGILKGMEDGSFSPKTSVTRAQIAVMMGRVDKECDYSYRIRKLVSISTTNDHLLKTKDSSGKADDLVYNDDTEMRVMGEAYKPEDMLVGVNAVLTFSGDKLLSIDAISSQPDETVKGRYMSKQNTSGKLFISMIPTGESKSVSYECAPDVSMMFDGSPSEITSFQKDDPLELEISDGKVVSINGTKKEVKISNATIVNVSILPSLTVTISHADDAYDGKTYEVSDNVSVRKNDVPSSMDQIYAGDKVALTLEYDKITSIKATSTTSTKEGVIRSITFSDRPSIVVSVQGEEQTYEVTKDCKITVNDAEAELYDFRVGDSVTLTIEGGAVKRIRAVSSMTTNGTMTGVVTSVNASYGFINVMPSDGSGIAQTVFCKDTTTKFLIATTGEEKKMASVKVGDTVQVNGSVSNGAFVAKIVLVTPAAQ